MISARSVVLLACLVGSAGACDSPDTANRGASTAPGGLESEVSSVPTPQDFETALLEDGLTFEEYEEAFFAFVGCVQEFGYELQSDPVLTSRQNYEYQLGRRIIQGETEQDRSAATASFESCRTEYFDAVQRQWVIQTAMTEAELQQARDHLGACMRSAGYELPIHPAQEDWTDYIRVIEGADPAPREAFRACLPLTQAEFGMRSNEVP